MSADVPLPEPYLARVRSEVDRIRAIAESGDDEAAFATEYVLRRFVLLAIAQGHPDAAELATAALATETFPFERFPG